MWDNSFNVHIVSIPRVRICKWGVRLTHFHLWFCHPLLPLAFHTFTTTTMMTEMKNIIHRMVLLVCMLQNSDHCKACLRLLNHNIVDCEKKKTWVDDEYRSPSIRKCHKAMDTLWHFLDGWTPYVCEYCCEYGCDLSAASPRMSHPLLLFTLTWSHLFTCMYVYTHIWGH